MTIVCCWFDESSGRERLTMIADGRVSTKKGNDWVPLTDTTTKLFRMPIQCFSMDNFDVDIAGWRQPYFRSEICVGFSGYCLEAFSIISLLSRCLERLVTVDAETNLLPCPVGITALAEELGNRYFRNHNCPETHVVDMLLCGFSPITGDPWASEVGFRRKGGTSEVHDPIGRADFLAIGDGKDRKDFSRRIEEVRRRIAKHHDRVRLEDGEDAFFAQDLEKSRHKLADKKSIEKFTLELLQDEGVTSVGGVLQKMEVYRVERHQALVSFSRDDRRDILDNLPFVSANGCLGFVPLAEKLGRET